MAYISKKKKKEKNPTLCTWFRKQAFKKKPTKNCIVLDIYKVYHLFRNRKRFFFLNITEREKTRVTSFQKRNNGTPTLSVTFNVLQAQCWSGILSFLFFRSYSFIMLLVKIGIVIVIAIIIITITGAILI